MMRLLMSILLFPVFGCMGGGSAPAPPVMIQPVEQQDAGVVSARDGERQRRRMAASNTILTGPQGLATAAPTTTKTLLGA